MASPVCREELAIAVSQHVCCDFDCHTATVLLEALPDKVDAACSVCPSFSATAGDAGTIAAVFDYVSSRAWKESPISASVSLDFFINYRIMYEVGQLEPEPS